MKDLSLVAYIMKDESIWVGTPQLAGIEIKLHNAMKVLPLDANALYHQSLSKQERHLELLKLYAKYNAEGKLNPELSIQPKLIIRQESLGLAMAKYARSAAQSQTKDSGNPPKQSKQ